MTSTPRSIPPPQPRRGAPTREGLPFVRGRLNVILLLFTAVMGLFAIRMYQLTILEGPRHFRESEENFLRQVSIAAPRGRILDRNGRPLAINRSVFEVNMSPLRLSHDEITSTVARVASLLDRPRINRLADQVARRRPRENSVTLAGGLTLEQVLPVLEQRFMLPGVMVQAGYERVYPEGAVAGLITGHVGGITSAELGAYLARGYLRNEKIGRNNAERSFEHVLRGAHGSEILWRDHVGRTRMRRVDRPVQPGNTIRLTIDLELQRLADALLEGWDGVIVALDPRDGAVLAMAARPGYDPNHPMRGSQFNKVFQRSRPIGGRHPGYPPGSTFKIVTAAAGLIAGYSPDEGIHCGGLITLGRARFPCHLRWGHGYETLSDALTHSCNVYFYTWGRRAGADRMIDTTRAFGFGAPTGFELAPPGQESPGHVARPGIDPIYPGSLLHLSIGQGELLTVSPIQVARAFAALCNGGVLLRPRIVHQIRNGDGEPIESVAGPHGSWRVGKAQPQGRLPLSDDQRQVIQDALLRVTHDAGGTGRHGRFNPDWRVAGKTGTAQTGRPESDAWFVGYAPADEPEIVVVVLVEQGGSGGEVASPLARQMFAMYFGQPEPEIKPPPLEDEEDGDGDGDGD